MMMLKNFSWPTENAYNISLERKQWSAYTVVYAVGFQPHGQSNIDVSMLQNCWHETSQIIYSIYLWYGIVVGIFSIPCIFQILFFTMGMDMCCLHNNTFLKSLVEIRIDPSTAKCDISSSHVSEELPKMFRVCAVLGEIIASILPGALWEWGSRQETRKPGVVYLQLLCWSQPINI